MQNKSKTLRRLTVLYILFFVVVILSLATSFRRGFAAGWNDAQRVRYEAETGNRRVDIFYDLNVTDPYADFDIPVYEYPAGPTTVKARPSSFDAEIIQPAGNKPKGLGLASLFWTLSMLSYLAIFIIIFIILNSLRRSIRTGDVFARSNIILTRLIGILLIAGSLLLSLGTWMERRALAGYFADFPYALNTSFPFNFSGVMMGVLIFVVAEIFVIGYSLSEEQKLTI